MIFGLGFATIITLIVVPCMYLLHYNLKQKIKNRRNKKDEPVAIEAAH
jgi:hypothetical protein